MALECVTNWDFSFSLFPVIFLFSNLPSFLWRPWWQFYFFSSEDKSATSWHSEDLSSKSPYALFWKLLKPKNMILMSIRLLLHDPTCNGLPHLDNGLCVWQCWSQHPGVSTRECLTQVPGQATELWHSSPESLPWVAKAHQHESFHRKGKCNLPFAFFWSQKCMGNLHFIHRFFTHSGNTTEIALVPRKWKINASSLNAVCLVKTF